MASRRKKKKQLPRNVYPHRHGFRGQRQVNGQMIRTTTFEAPAQAAAELALLCGDEPPSAGIVQDLEEAGEQLDAARQAVNRALASVSRATKSKPKGRG